MRIGSALCVAALLLAGCSGADSGGSGPARGSAPASAPALSGEKMAKVEAAAAVARQIQSNPAGADEALRRQGMTEQQFEDLMYEIAADAEMSEAYARLVGP